MKPPRLVRLAAIGAFAAAPAWAAQSNELTWRDVLRLAEQNSPALSASRQREAAARYSVGLARAGYLPSIEWDEMDSSRFPESSETLGIGGLVGSPYSTGRVSAAVAKGTLWDFGRTGSNVDEAKETVELRQEESRLTRYAVEQAALFAFFDCSRYRSQTENWRSLAEQAQVVANEIAHFVKTGQRSVVHRMLAEAQLEEAQIEEAGYRRRWDDALKRLAVWTGGKPGDLACPAVSDADEEIPLISSPAVLSPLVARAEADAKIANSRVSRTKADYWPKLVAAASAGNLQQAGAKQNAAYAFAGGLVLPIFDGMRTPNQVRQAEALAAEKEKEVAAAEQRVADFNARYDEAIDSSKARLLRLKRKLEAGEKAFNLANERYFSFQGDVTDLREALRNLAQTRSQIIDDRTQLLEASGAKALLLGNY